MRYLDPMNLKCVKSFLAFFLVLLVTMAGFAQLPESCPDEKVQAQHSVSHTSEDSHVSASHHDHETNHSEQDHDCHCPFHHSHCHHQHNLRTTAVVLTTPLFFSSSYLESLFSTIPGPDLDGPFQPPRA